MEVKRQGGCQEQGRAWRGLIATAATVFPLMGLNCHDLSDMEMEAVI